MNLFDLHCDTALRMYTAGQALGSGSCHVSLDRAAGYGHYAQVMAVFSPSTLDDEAAYRQFHHDADNLLREADAERARAMLCRTSDDLHTAWDAGRAALFLAVEDARLLSGRLDRLDVLAARGVKFLTLNWSGTTCIGGAHNTSDGLTPFGREVVMRCFALGIVPDLSHASDAVTDEVIGMARAAGKPVIATHSNARSVRDHKRNLTDAQFCAIRDLGGIVGISLCREHLSADGEVCDAAAVIRHIEHYLSLGGEKTVCFGCDLDGTDLPDGFAGIGDLHKIADGLTERGHSDDLIADICFGNAVRFVEKNC